MNDQKNTLLFILLSAVILIGWQIFFGVPQMERQKQQQQSQQPSTSTPPITAPAPQAPSPQSAPTMTREQALGHSPRVGIETPRLAGSIALKSGRIDDLSLTQFRETVDPS